MNKIILNVVVAFYFLFFVNNLMACFCLKLSLEEEFEDSNSVFVAKVVAIEIGLSPTGYKVKKNIVEIEKYFKDNKVKVEYIITSLDDRSIGSGCPRTKMVVGERYLIFNNVDEKYSYYPFCSNSQRLIDGESELLEKIEAIKCKEKLK